jgi:hypothetical protein
MMNLKGLVRKRSSGYRWEGPFPGGKARLRRDADHSPQSSAEVVKSRSYTSSPPCAFIGVLSDCFTFYLFVFVHMVKIAFSVGEMTSSLFISSVFAALGIFSHKT